MTAALDSGRGLFLARAAAVFSTILSLLASALVVIGLYGLVTYMAAERTREIGIRIALGATTTQITTLVIRQCARLSMVGIGVGTAAGLVLMRVIPRLLYGLAPVDAAALIGAAAAMVTMMLAATCLPALRASTADPVVALRAD